MPAKPLPLRKRGLIRVDARRSNWDGLQGGFCSKYRDICKKTNAADCPIRVIARRDELIRASLRVCGRKTCRPMSRFGIPKLASEYGGLFVQSFPSKSRLGAKNTPPPVGITHFLSEDKVARTFPRESFTVH